MRRTISASARLPFIARFPTFFAKAVARSRVHRLFSTAYPTWGLQVSPLTATNECDPQRIGIRRNGEAVGGLMSVQGVLATAVAVLLVAAAAFALINGQPEPIVFGVAIVFSFLISLTSPSDISSAAEQAGLPSY
jgi:hypothetical protein